MAFTRPTLPFKLTPEDMGAFNAPKAAGQGASYIDHIIQTKLKSLESKKAEAQLPYAIDDIKSLIAIRNAQARLENINAAKGETTLNLFNGGSSGGMGGSSDVSQNPNAPNPSISGTQGAGADSGYSYDANGDNTVASPQEINNAGGIDTNIPDQSSQAGAPRMGAGWTVVNQDEPGMAPQSDAQSGQSFSPQMNVGGNENKPVPGTPGQSYYGVMMPSPTGQQMAQSNLTGVNTYGKQAELAAEAQKKQIEEYNKLSTGASKAAETSQDLLNSFKQFDKSLEHVKLKGAQLGKAPKWLSSEERDNAIRLSGQLGKSGISVLKEAMGNSRFAVMEFQYGIDNLSPNITWSQKAIDSYGDKLKAANTRVQEQKDLINYYKNNPQLGVKKEDVDSLISSLQTQYPIINDKGHIQKKNLNKAALYVTPEAIQSVRQFGRYYPKDEAKNDNAIGDEIAKTPYGGGKKIDDMTREEIQAELAGMK